MKHINTKTLAAGGLAALLACSFAVAQNNGKGPPGGPRMGDPEQRLERMREHLGLSDQQVEDIRAIQAQNIDRREKREQIRAVFTEEQRGIADQHRERRFERRPGRRGAPPAAPEPPPPVAPEADD